MKKCVVENVMDKTITQFEFKIRNKRYAKYRTLLVALAKIKIIFLPNCLRNYPLVLANLKKTIFLFALIFGNCS